MRKYIFLSIMLLISSCETYTDNQDRKLSLGVVPEFKDLTPTTDYVFYNDYATMPTLYIAMHLTTHTKPSFLHEYRGSIDKTKLPSHVQVVANGDDFKVKVAEINAKEPNATFTIYLNELIVANASTFFYNQGISEDRVNVVQITEGTFGATQWRADFNNNNAYNEWKRQEKFYLDNKDKSLERGFFSKNNGFLTVPSIMKNTKAWFFRLDLFNTPNQKLVSYLNSNSQNYYNVDPIKYFNSLTQSQKNLFIELIGLNKKYTSADGSDSTLNNQTIKEAFDQSPKPNLIITGTNPYGADTDRLIADVKKFYGDKYDYFYKGHPSDRQKPADTTLTILPYKMPIEGMFFAYSQDITIIGGYQSSLYMSAPDHAQKFFFKIADNGSDLFAPLDEMFRLGLFGNVKIFR